MELIFSIVLLGILIASSMSILNLLFKENRQTFDTALTKIDFETTRLFLETKIKDDQNLAYLIFSNSKLFYKNDLLNDNVSSFRKTIGANDILLNICIKQNNLFCTDIYIKTKP